MILVKVFQMRLPGAFGKESFGDTSSKLVGGWPAYRRGQDVKRTGRYRLHALQPANCQFSFRRHPRVLLTTTGALGGCLSLSDILTMNAAQVLLELRGMENGD
jgi:hypothetical protein